MSTRSTVAMATLAASLCLGLAQARADFCLNGVVNGTDSFFFRFDGKYPTKPDKVTKLNGKVLSVEGAAITDRGPAYGQMLGLPAGGAGNSRGMRFDFMRNKVG